MQSEIGNHKSAILLLGPTGSGKTPLGEYLEDSGLWGKQCFHFDFGANLRNAAERGKDADFIKEVLAGGLLLENEHFHIAEEILRSFMQKKNVGDEDLVVLNGLPRHVGQADDVDGIVRIEQVVHLRCSPQVVFERIAGNTGGDRDGREDDSVDKIRNKLEIFRKRTAPLLDHYRKKNAGIVEVEIQADTRPAEIVGKISNIKIEV